MSGLHAAAPTATAVKAPQRNARAASHPAFSHRIIVPTRIRHTTRPAVNTAEVNISLNCQGWIKVIGTWPEVFDFERDLGIGRLDFEPPDHQRFPSLGLARAAARAGGTAPAVLNAANEVAVQAFLDRRLNFTGIATVIDKVLQRLDSCPVKVLGDVLDADAAARRLAIALIELSSGALA